MLMSYSLSIIIPVYNGEKFINKNFDNCLNIIKKIKAQIIYIDNCSQDKSFLKLRKKIKNNKDFTLLKVPKKFERSPGIARNLGIQKSKSNNIIFLDIDDKLETKNLSKLLTFLSNKNTNFIYLKKKTINQNMRYIKSHNPFISYTKNNMSRFFRKNNNMAVISIIFKKKILIKNKLIFQKGIYEDIFFLFKAHFYNSKKIYYFPFTVYIKCSHSKSITGSALTFQHLERLFFAWKNIDKFLRKKLNKKRYNALLGDIQYRWRGEFANEYKKIKNSNLSLSKKREFFDFIVNRYKRFIIPNFNSLTLKDKIVKNILKLN